jgi:putative SOS response-associated peptidase YedK
MVIPELDQATSTGCLSTTMCNLCSLKKKRDAVARFFRVSHNRGSMFEPLPAIFPRHVAPVARATADAEREIVTMSWVFMLLQNSKAPRPVTNVRDDTILKSSFWKSTFVQCRCLVPAKHRSANPMAK